MNEKEILHEGIHPEATLLPWYANGTLSEAERQQVARHLESCRDCLHQFEEVTELRNRLGTLYENQRAPSRQQAQSIFAQVAKEASARRSARVPRQLWSERVESWIGTFFIPQWVPALAATVIFVQFGLLVWLTMPQAPSEQITTRSLSSPMIRFKVTFQEMATEKQIRALLSEVRGKIISGPGSDQNYLVEVVGGSEAITRKMLETLRAQTDVVRTVEVASD